jgi:MoxR-like ATPase
MGSSLELIRRLEESVARALVGKPDVVRLAVVGLVARGHLLIEDVPGVGKTTLAAALARSIGVGFQRIQFTSDMLPSDILGVSVYQPDKNEFVFKPGPLFTNIVLADEINRTTPKTQSSLLEAMNEAQVSLDHSTYPLPRPFMVLATQNPLEYEGTHPLPESQLDRFLLRIRIGYPELPDEKAILRGEAAAPLEGLDPVLGIDDVLWLQDEADRVRAEESLLDYVMALVAATRSSPLLALGVSPRGSLALLRAARAHALADGRDYLVPDDVKRLAVPALAHRVLLRSRLGAQGDGGRAGTPVAMDAEGVIRSIVQQVPVPR